MDVAGAARAARQVGAFVLVDGAQALGAIPADPHRVGADAYAFPAQKWLLRPEGLGGLWVAQEALERIDLTFGGMGSGTAHGIDGSLTLHPDARKLEPGLLPEILVPGWSASLDWLAGLRVAGVDVEAAAATLEGRGTVLRWVPQRRALRVSIGFFNDERDMARLAAGLDDLTG